MPWSAMVHQDPFGSERDCDCLGCLTFQCAFDHPVRNRFLCSHCILQVSFEQESGCHLFDIIRDILGVCIVI